jgi:DME family drug/metabolite transporter
MLWGTAGVTSRALFQTSDTNPLSVGFFRMALATPVLALLCWRTLRGRAFHIARRDLWIMLLAGAMLALSQACYFASIVYSGVAIATLITLCGAPVLVAMLSAAFMRERITVATVSALIFALAGAVLLVGVQPDRAAYASAGMGGLFALGAAVGYSVFMICSRHLAQAYHPLQTITVGFAAGSLLLLVLAESSGFVTGYSPAAWGLLIYLGSVPSALAYSLFLAGMRTTTATLASVTALLEPLTATALAWALFGEQLTPPGILGAALLLGAIVVLNRKEDRPLP